LESWGSNDDAAQVANVTGGPENEASNPEAKMEAESIQILNGELQFRGIKIQIHEEQKILRCSRCGKKFQDEKVLNGIENPVETQVRNHIVAKHPPGKHYLHGIYIDV